MGTSVSKVIGNYYGTLHVRKNGESYEWSIEDWDGHTWEKIPESLAVELIRFKENIDEISYYTPRCEK